MITPSMQVLHDSEHKYDFENIIVAINRIFQSRSFVLQTKGEVELTDLIFSCPLKPTVSMNSEIIELNFRMIESYMPEILLAFCLRADGQKTINDVITTLVNNGFPNTATIAPKLFLQHKILMFLEVMLFADLFNTVWDGKYQEGKCYVFRQGTELQYYTSYNIKVLLKELLSRYSIYSMKSFNSNIHSYTFSIYSNGQ